MMDLGFYGVFIIAAVLAVQFFFSTRNSPYWGFVVPIAYFAFLTYMFATNRIDNFLQYILIFILGILFLVLEWKSGRKYFNEKTEKELDKMKTRDLR